jgi:ABC-type uncharacterized transport system ATPase subunit
MISYMRKKIVKQLKKDIKEHTIFGMAGKIKIPYTTLHRILNKQGSCTLRTWDLLEKYYNKIGLGAVPPSGV